MATTGTESIRAALEAARAERRLVRLHRGDIPWADKVSGFIVGVGARVVLVAGGRAVARRRLAA